MTVSHERATNVSGRAQSLKIVRVRSDDTGRPEMYELGSADVS